MKFNLWAKIFCFVLFVLEPLYAQEENTNATNDYLIIINANNTYKNEISKGLRKIELIYKGNSKEWPGRLKATFISRGFKNVAQKKFYKRVLRMEIDEVENYWNNKKSNGIYRPKEISNVRDLINQISKDTGAISVISKAEIDKIPAKIRVLYEF